MRAVFVVNCMNKIPDIGAIWLPGFHKDPKNDVWWGENFTEWDNVASSRPLFKEHKQPVIPLNGYYNLSDRDSLLSQFSQAADFGISVIGGYHYWFSGERLLSAPEKWILEAEELPVRYFAIWANHSWSRAWTNRDGDPETLILQTYSNEDAILHSRHLARLASKSFYYKINGRPLIAIYDPVTLVRNCPDYLEIFRENFKKEVGLDMAISWGVRTKNELAVVSKVIKECDFISIFEPSFSLSIEQKASSRLQGLFHLLPKWMKSLVLEAYTNHDTVKTFDYGKFSSVVGRYQSAGVSLSEKYIASVFCGFDNTPRYGDRARIFLDYSPEKFGESLEELLCYSASKKVPLIMINALNEWGEGMNLEPCNHYKFRKLEIVREITESLVRRKSE